MFNKLDRKESGFTIVEVMIVMAIAGLVLAIVFIAVPALQRNARNTQRTADVSNIQAQFNTYASNNNGRLPGHNPAATPAVNDFINMLAEGTGTTMEFYLDGANATAANAPNTVPTSVRTKNVTYMPSPTATAINGTASLPGPDELHIWGGLKCSGDSFEPGNTNNAPTTVQLYGASAMETATSRSLVFIYQLEGEVGATCVDNT